VAWGGWASGGICTKMDASQEVLSADEVVGRYEFPKLAESCPAAPER